MKVLNISDHLLNDKQIDIMLDYFKVNQLEIVDLPHDPQETIRNLPMNTDRRKN